MPDTEATTGNDAESIAISVLTFLAGRPEELARFLSLSGVDPASIRQLADEPAFLGGILDFLLQDEALLLAFAAEHRLSPNAVAAARRHFDDHRAPFDSDQT